MAYFAIILAILAVVSARDKIRPDDPLIQEWLADQQGSRRAGVKAAAPTFVTIKNGTLEGTTYIAMGGDKFYAYLGIPYATPPLGELRFQPPQPFEDAWGTENPRPAYHHPNACIQWLTNLTTASEDCLFLSVYTKRSNESNTDPLPVMYWIHGGGFLLGQTSYYTATKLMQNDVVVVTVQYRLGPLGFLSTYDSAIAGNAGMKDMVLGLRWVQENIAAFGGDPGRVTVFGESAGGAAATFMLISPLAKGLFHQIAAMSGTAIAEWSMDRDPVGSITKLATLLECSTDSSEAIRACLVTKSWQDIASTHFGMMLAGQVSELRANLAGTSPTVEHPHDGAFISQEPLELLEHGEIAQVPVMMGANQHEGSFLLGLAYALRLWNSTNDENYVSHKLLGDLLATWGVYEDTNGASISQALAAGFIPMDNPKTNFTTFQYELVDLTSILFMKAPVLRTAEILSRRVPSVYFYSFEYRSQNSLWNFLDLIPIFIPELTPLIPPFQGGTTHGDDLLFMFTLPILPSTNDLAMMRTYTKFFCDFATNRVPSQDWVPYTMKEPNYMQILSTPKLQQYYPMAWRQGLTLPESESQENEFDQENEEKSSSSSSFGRENIASIFLLFGLVLSKLV